VNRNETERARAVPAGKLRRGPASASRAKPSSAGAWLLAIRPRTLTAGAVPVLVGLALAARSGALEKAVAVATITCALLLQIAANLANDYFDWKRGIDTEHRLGPVRVTQAGLLSPGAMRAALAVVIGVAVLLGVFLVYRGGWPIVAIGIAAVLGALAYSAGPYPLASHGFGEVLVFVFFGLAAVCGTYWLQRGVFEIPVALAGLTSACPAVALIVVNNLRDIETDRTAGKRTVAVRLGAAGTRIEYASLVTAAFIGACILGIVSTAGACLALFALPLGLTEVRGVHAREGAALNMSLAGTARLHFVFGALLALGLAFG
jgi:1,4-dihydroxy-2-naphthoate octaprenyltransferase